MGKPPAPRGKPPAPRVRAKVIDVRDPNLITREILEAVDI